ncbi:mCG144698, partial [Mus musculus]
KRILVKQNYSCRIQGELEGVRATKYSFSPCAENHGFYFKCQRSRKNLTFYVLHRFFPSYQIRFK